MILGFLHKNQKYMHDKTTPGDGEGVIAFFIAVVLGLGLYLVWCIIKGVFNFIKNIFS